MKIMNIDGFRTFTKKAGSTTLEVLLSSREILPFSKYTIETNSKKTVYDIFHQNNAPAKVLKNGHILEDENTVRKIIKAAAKICCENGMIPRTLIGNLTQKEINILMKSMHK